MTSPENTADEMESGPDPRPEREGTVLADPSAADLVINDLAHEDDPREVVVFDVEALQEGESPADPNLPVEIVVSDQTLITDLGADGSSQHSSEHSSEITLATETARIDAVGSGVEVTVECPQCGLICEGVDPRPTAAWFCPRCDYPLFFAAPVPPAQISSDAARRRLPGTDGREMLAADACWACGELNPPGMTYCGRCGSELIRPRLAPLEEPEPIIIEAPPLIYVARRWPLILTGVAAGTLTTIVAVLIAIGLR
jgi:ribosomal protein L40E